MDAMTDPANLDRLSADAPEPGKRGRRRRNPLVDAIASLEPAERQAAIAAALAEVEEAERRELLLQQVKTLPTDQLARLLQAASDIRGPPSRGKSNTIDRALAPST